jgi:phosphoribosylaminoimidazolecarboxamide formyltransferase/IMP cyclohydrolase
MSRALLSVYDKTGLIPFAQGLRDRGFTLLASGGTARALVAEGLLVLEVAEVTGAAEVLDGRVKTLHPAIHAGILSRRTPADAQALGARGIEHIDVVVCNLYPFEDTLAGGADHAALVEQIDIGGVTLLRAAAKNAAHVTVVSSPEDYAAVLTALDDPNAMPALNRRLAAQAFVMTARYDLAIAGWLTGDAQITVAQAKVSDLRYGENPHQGAALYRPVGAEPAFEQVGGLKALSYNNLVDLDAARACAAEFEAPAVIVVKHTNPCGAATGATLNEAFERALASDPVSAFGSIIAVNRPVTADFVNGLGKLFVEVIVAPAWTDEALALLGRRKKNCRLIRCAIEPNPAPVLRPTFAGLLVQDADVSSADSTTWRVVTERAPSAAEHAALAFNWRVARHVKSNAIVFGVNGATVGVGAGQMNRVDAVFLAARRAGAAARGAVMASDAFFPFADGIEAAAQSGITAVIQPGGSIRDAEVIAAADRLGLAMIFTGQRHFRH